MAVKVMGHPQLRPDAPPVQAAIAAPVIKFQAAAI
jgi:hypothetical protein